jgi:hypothetical protein
MALLTLLQIIFSAITLALAAVIISKYGPDAPSLISYGAFCGGASILFALIGIAACFFEKLQGIIMLALDALTTLFLLAGGIVSHQLYPFTVCRLTTNSSGIRSYSQGWQLYRCSISCRSLQDLREREEDLRE